MNYQTNGEFANIMKYSSPPFSPGVRRWYNVKPESHKVEGLDTPFYSFAPGQGFPSGKPCCNYVVPKPQMENFGFQGDVTISKDVLRMVAVAIIVYLVWSYQKK